MSTTTSSTTSYEIYESRDGSHWRHHARSEDTSCQYGVACMLAHLLLVPPALVTMAVVVILVPLLNAADRIRGR